MVTFKYNHTYIPTYIYLKINAVIMGNIDCTYLIGISTNPSNVEYFLTFIVIIILLYQYTNQNNAKKLEKILSMIIRHFGPLSNFFFDQAIVICPRSNYTLSLCLYNKHFTKLLIPSCLRIASDVKNPEK